MICDFGADHAFSQVNLKLQEHYGIHVPASNARAITEYHAKKIQAQEDLCQAISSQSEVVIAECDGSMVPIVETFLNTAEGIKQDGRKHKNLFWKEVRLSMAHAQGSKTPYFAATIESVKKAGEQLLFCVKQSGGYSQSKVHCVGDGAVWIANQVEEQFGAKGSYLIDFYHLCEYLNAAALSCAPNNQRWLKIQKEKMKLSQHQEVLRTLQPHLEPKTIEETKAPVRACYRYINNRLNQLDYKSAIKQGLPIGSGEIESAHRYIVQRRLKIAGAWWNLENAKNMVALRVCRVNEHWENYWEKAA